MGHRGGMSPVVGLDAGGKICWRGFMRVMYARIARAPSTAPSTHLTSRHYRRCSPHSKYT